MRRAWHNRRTRRREFRHGVLHARPGPRRRQPHRRHAGADRGRPRARRPRARAASRCWCRTPPSGLHRVVDPEDQGQSEAEETLELALPLLEEAAGGPVEGIVGDPEPLAAIQDAVNLHGFDEIIISTLPKRFSRWLQLDLPHKAAGLGLPVTTVTARGREEVG